MEEYPIAHAYRDNRINRIFEGTNEVNRLVAAGTLFQRAVDGKLDLFSPFSDIDAQGSGGEAPGFAGPATPPQLRGRGNLGEGAQRAPVYPALKGPPKFIATIDA